MTRKLIAIAILGFAATAAFADPTLEMNAQERILNAPEATSYQADTQAAGGMRRLTERDEFQPFNP